MTLIKNVSKVLLVNPLTPTSYWGFQESSWFVGARAAHIPLSLITIAALLPVDWDIRLIDLNVEELRDEDIAWADAVMMTGMIVQKDSMSEIIGRCAMLGVPTIVGGPFVSSSPEAKELARATALVIGEAEDGELLEGLMNDMEARRLRPTYVASGKPSMACSPTPRYDLLRPKAYVAMAMQVSRGCPHGCEFCNVRALFGRRPRYKTASQVIAELEEIRATGFRGNVFFVDDNFIGDTRKAKGVLEAVAAWQAANGYPFLFYTEADVRLAQLNDIIDLMVQAGFFAVFMGFETPSADALKASLKTQNLKVDAAASARHLRSRGLLVYGGFIVGFDSDDTSIFDAMRLMIEDCRIDFAMAGMLTAIPGTPLEARLRLEGRLVEGRSNDTFDETNIEPKRMTRLELLRGYRELLKSLYEPRRFFSRAYAALVEWRQVVKRKTTAREYLAVIRSVVRQGIFSRYSAHYWGFMLKTLFSHPRKIARAFATAISGHHFFRYTRKVVMPRLIEAERRLQSADQV